MFRSFTKSQCAWFSTAEATTGECLDVTPQQPFPGRPFSPPSTQAGLKLPPGLISYPLPLPGALPLALAQASMMLGASQC